MLDRSGPDRGLETGRRGWRHTNTFKEEDEGPRSQMGDEGAERREGGGVKGILQICLSPGDSLVFVSGCVVMKRTSSVQDLMAGH